MRIYKYEDFVNEYQYQTGGSLPTFHFKGVNYGDSVSKSDVGKANFGNKGDDSMDKREPMKKLNNKMVYSEHTGKYYSEQDIKNVLSEYSVWLKQNNEESIPIDTVDGETLDYILKEMDSE